MSRFLLVLVAFSLLAAAGPGAAQSPAAQPPAPQPPATATPQPPERKPLILHLDEASRRQILFGPGGSQSTEGTTRASDGLPSLGGDARSMVPDTRAGSASSPYPKQAADGLPD